MLIIKHMYRVFFFNGAFSDDERWRISPIKKNYMSSPSICLFHTRLSPLLYNVNLGLWTWCFDLYPNVLLSQQLNPVAKKSRDIGR